MEAINKSVSTTKNKADWFEEARSQIESGKAGFGASDDYKNIATKEPASNIPDLNDIVQEIDNPKPQITREPTTRTLYRGGQYENLPNEPMSAGKLGVGYYFSADKTKAGQYGKVREHNIPLGRHLDAEKELSLTEAKKIFGKDINQVFYGDNTRRVNEILEDAGRLQDTKAQNSIYNTVKRNYDSAGYSDGFEVVFFRKPEEIVVGSNILESKKGINAPVGSPEGFSPTFGVGKLRGGKVPAGGLTGNVNTQPVNFISQFDKGSGGNHKNIIPPPTTTPKPTLADALAGKSTRLSKPIGTSKIPERSVDELFRELDRPKLGSQYVAMSPDEINSVMRVLKSSTDEYSNKVSGLVRRSGSANNSDTRLVMGYIPGTEDRSGTLIEAIIDPITGKPTGEIVSHSTPLNLNDKNIVGRYEGSSGITDNIAPNVPVERLLENPTYQKPVTQPTLADALAGKSTRLPPKEIKPPTQKVTPDAQPLPERNTKMVSKTDKLLRSTRSIIERQGENGKLLAGKLQSARDSKEIYLSELQQAMPTVTKLARKGRNAIVNKDFENFVEATQGRAKPKNATIAKAIKEWQAAHPGIRQRGVDAGLEIGDLGPTYYPHFIDYERVFKDTNTYNKAINHLVETNQAPTPEEAIKLLNYAKDVSRNRQFGNLESERLIDLPFYDKTPNSLISYLNGSAKRITNTETFGAKDEEALKLITKAGQQGYDTEAMKNAFDVAVGAKQYSQTSSAISGGVRKYITTTRLGLGALTNVSQNVNTGIVTGHTRTLSSAVKALSKKNKQFVADTGVISDALLNDLKTQQGYSSFSSKVIGKAINKVTAPGFGKVEQINRSISAIAGRDYGLRLAQKGNETALRKLGVTGDIANKTLTEAQQIQVAREVVRKTQFKVDPQDLPGWADSPGGKLIAQFRTFSYNQSKFFSNEVIKPAAKGNLVPLGRVLAALPVGYGLYETRRVIDGRPEEENENKVALASFSKIGGAGLVLDLYQSLNPLNSEYIPSDRRVTMALGAAGGPAVGVGTQAVGAVSEFIQRKNTPADESKLEGKVTLAKGEKYTDATPISRFGLSQIPIVGTPIKNRLLPYKKQSEAETGKVATGDDKLDTKLNQFKQSDKDYKTEYTKSLSSKERALVALSQTERKKVISDGLASKSDFDSLDKRVENIKSKYNKTGKSNNTQLPPGLNNNDIAVLERFGAMDADQKDKVIRTDPKAEYSLKVAEFERDKKLNKFSRAELINQKESVAKSKVGSNFAKDTREIYGLSKDEANELLSTADDGQKAAEQIIAYGDALVAAGVAKYNKFRDRKGNIAIAPKAKGGGGGRKSGGRTARSSRTTDFNLYSGGKGGTSNSVALSKTLRQLIANAKIS
jgi:hypothetical protein